MDDIIKLISLIGFKKYYEIEFICEYRFEYNNWEYIIHIRKTVIKIVNKIEILRINDNVKLHTEYDSSIIGLTECLNDIKLIFQNILRKKKIEKLFDGSVEKNA